MSGSLLPFSDVLESSEVPDSPEQKVHSSRELVRRSRSRSSSDPINLITPTNTAHPITVDDDDIVEEQRPPPSRPRPSTPKGKTPLREGQVQEQIAKFNKIDSKPQNQHTLAGFLVPAPISQSGSSSRTSTNRGPSSRGNPISPGMTRRSQQPTLELSVQLPPRPGIVGRMKQNPVSLHLGHLARYWC
jgi:hypothetical protein